MFNVFTRVFSTTKNDKVIKKIIKYQNKIKNLIIENNIPMTGYSYSYSFHEKKINDKNFNEKENITDKNTKITIENE